jgi:hypothetical protein
MITMLRGPVLAGMIVLLWVAPSAVAGNFLDDSCPDGGGQTFVVDTPLEAQSVANGYDLPSCNLVLRTSLDPAAITRPILQITAKSMTLEGPLEITNPLVESVIVLRVVDGHLTLSQARLMARDTIRLECHGKSACNISINGQSHLQASRVVRTIATGRLTIEDTRIVSGEIDARAGGRR